MDEKKPPNNILQLHHREKAPISKTDGDSLEELTEIIENLFPEHNFILQLKEEFDEDGNPSDINGPMIILSNADQRQREQILVITMASFFENRQGTPIHD